MHAARRLRRASGALATAATARMDQRLAWFRDLPPDERSWVSLVAQTGIQAFVGWLDHDPPRPAVTVDVFDTAPRDLARTISLEQTVEMVRCTIELIEEHLPQLAGEDEAEEVRAAVLVYSREVAFAAAAVYARAAEARGAWDARLEALVLEGMLRGDDDPGLIGRAATLGWTPERGAVVMVGRPPVTDDTDVEVGLDQLRRSAHHHRLDLLAGLHGDALVAVVAVVDADEARVIRLLTPHFGAGPVITTDRVTGLSAIAGNARGALWALRAARGWPQAPRPVHAAELLAERALAGEPGAGAELVASVYAPLLAADPVLVDTLAVYLEQAGSLEGTARAMFVHTNTVRHRLRRIEQVTRRSPTDPRDSLALRLALVWGRMGDFDQAL